MPGFSRQGLKKRRHEIFYVMDPGQISLFNFKYFVALKSNLALLYNQRLVRIHNDAAHQELVKKYKRLTSLKRLLP